MAILLNLVKKNKWASPNALCNSVNSASQSILQHKRGVQNESSSARWATRVDLQQCSFLLL